MALRTRGMNPKIRLADMMTRATGKVGATPDPILPGPPNGLVVRGADPFEMDLARQWMAARDGMGRQPGDWATARQMLAQRAPQVAEGTADDWALARQMLAGRNAGAPGAGVASDVVPGVVRTAADDLTGAATKPGVVQRLRDLLPGGIGKGGAAAEDAAGFLSGLKSSLTPASLMRGGAGLGAGLVTGMAVDPILGMAIGGEAEDPGFSWGGLGKGLLSGAAAGGVGAGVASGGAAALPGAAIGAALGGLGYLYSEATQKNVPGIDENVKTMQDMADQYGTDPELTNKVVGSYRLLADLYKKNGMEDKIPDLTTETFTRLAGVLGTPAPKPLLNTSDLGTLSKMMYEQTSPWLNQMSPDSPYRVALMQQLANFPTSLVLAGATTPQQVDSAVAGSGLQGLAMDQTKASGQGAALAAGLSQADMAKLVAQGIKM